MKKAKLYAQHEKEIILYIGTYTCIARKRIARFQIEYINETYFLSETLKERKNERMKRKNNHIK